MLVRARVPVSIYDRAIMGQFVVGICTHSELVRYSVWYDTGEVVAADLVRAVQGAGALALLIPRDDELVDEPDQVLGRIDGLIIDAAADDERADGAEGRLFAERLGDRATRTGVPVLRIASSPETDGSGSAPAGEVGRFVAGLGR
jgi:hypothetical protein